MFTNDKDKQNKTVLFFFYYGNTKYQMIYFIHIEKLLLKFSSGFFCVCCCHQCNMCNSFIVVSLLSNGKWRASSIRNAGSETCFFFRFFSAKQMNTETSRNENRKEQKKREKKKKQMETDEENTRNLVNGLWPYNPYIMQWNA